MKIYLVRHGHSLWQENPSDNWDTSLSPVGHDQAKHLGKWLSEGARLDYDTCLMVGSLVTSPLKRARETATYIGDSLGLTANVQDNLTEATFHVVSELPQQPAPFASWLEGEPSSRYLNFRDQTRAAVEAWAQRAEEIRQPVFAVTHGGLIKTVMRVIAESDVFNLKIYNCGITAIEWQAGRWRILHVNLWDHLPPHLRTA